MSSDLMEMLVGVPALPLERFVVVGGLSPNLFPTSEVHFILPFRNRSLFIL